MGKRLSCSHLEAFLSLLRFSRSLTLQGLPSYFLSSPLSKLKILVRTLKLLLIYYYYFFALRIASKTGGKVRNKVIWQTSLVFAQLPCFEVKDKNLYRNRELGRGDQLPIKLLLVNF